MMEYIGEVWASWMPFMKRDPRNYHTNKFLHLINGEEKLEAYPSFSVNIAVWTASSSSISSTYL